MTELSHEKVFAVSLFFPQVSVLILENNSRNYCSFFFLNENDNVAHFGILIPESYYPSILGTSTQHSFKMRLFVASVTVVLISIHMGILHSRLT